VCWRCVGDTRGDGRGDGRGEDVAGDVGTCSVECMAKGGRLGSLFVDSIGLSGCCFWFTRTCNLVVFRYDRALAGRILVLRVLFIILPLIDVDRGVGVVLLVEHVVESNEEVEKDIVEVCIDGVDCLFRCTRALFGRCNNDSGLTFVLIKRPVDHIGRPPLPFFFGAVTGGLLGPPLFPTAIFLPRPLNFNIAETCRCGILARPHHLPLYIKVGCVWLVPVTGICWLAFNVWVPGSRMFSACNLFSAIVINAFSAMIDLCFNFNRLICRSMN
jgi:hypothetical protein